MLTLDDIGDVNKVPTNVKLNFNSYVIPTPAWLLAPFPIGTRNRRQADDSHDGILNIGLTYNLPGALAHRNAFYELAGGDTASGGGFTLPNLLLDVTLADCAARPTSTSSTTPRLRSKSSPTKSRVVIELETTTFEKTLRP